jgi:hypothetical protein
MDHGCGLDVAGSCRGLATSYNFLNYAVIHRSFRKFSYGAVGPEQLHHWIHWVPFFWAFPADGAFNPQERHFVSKS